MATTPQQAEIPSLTQPVTVLKGVGEKVAERLQKLGITQVQDLLFHLPLRYQDRTRVWPISALRSRQEGLVEGEITDSRVVFGRRRSLVCHIKDSTGVLMVRFFHFGASQQRQLAAGVRLRCFGEARAGKAGLEMAHPEYQIIKDDDLAPVSETLTPVYPTTDGLHQLSWRKLLAQALGYLDTGALTELLPAGAKLLPEAQADLADAMRYVHCPPPDADVTQLQTKRHPFQRRFAYEELLAHQVSMRRIRQLMTTYSAPKLIADSDLHTQFLAALPFKLTAAQQRVSVEIAADLTQNTPMQRLVQGDVGSGKTVVAALAMLAAVAAGKQAALMAPTELLAEQHYRNFTEWFTPLGITVGWCASKQTAAARRDIMAQLADGRVQVAVGTHALFQDAIVFDDLGLVVIDEQHRFGVAQRLALRDKGKTDGSQPHQLVMTATPIPRTLAMTAFADLDVSVIDELPPGRTPVKTVVLPDSRRSDIIERIHAACQHGRQAYWVCTLIEESEHLDCQAAEVTATELQEALPDVRVGLVHGRLKSVEKEQIMQAFKAAELDLLVATTVIEVGVDVPNASLMVIENAERLGLAQLHQLRGRVGRGEIESHCVLLYTAPLSKNGKTRLGCLRDTNDGFAIAQQDLELRGPGELLGSRQTGLPQFRVADLDADQDLLTVMPQATTAMLATSEAQVDALVTRWFGSKMDFGEV